MTPEQIQQTALSIGIAALMLGFGISLLSKSLPRIAAWLLALVDDVRQPTPRQHWYRFDDTVIDLNTLAALERLGSKVVLTYTSGTVQEMASFGSIAVIEDLWEYLDDMAEAEDDE